MAKAVEPVSDREAKKVVFKLPEKMKHTRGLTRLVRSDNMIAVMQFLTKGGGERNLHSHDALDGLWFVLSGRVRFYGPDNALIAEAGPHEGVFVPKAVPYWFEQVGEEPLQLLQVEAIETSITNNSRLHGKSETVSFQKFGADGTLVGESTITPEEVQTTTL